MDMRQLIAPEQVIGLRAKGKMQLLQELARRAAKPLGIDVQPILKALTAREELGSTGVGHGIALPHARIPGLARLFSLFARLEKPIEVDADVAPLAGDLGAARALRRACRDRIAWRGRGGAQLGPLHPFGRRSITRFALP